MAIKKINTLGKVSDDVLYCALHCLLLSGHMGKSGLMSASKQQMGTDNVNLPLSYSYQSLILTFVYKLIS